MKLAGTFLVAAISITMLAQERPPLGPVSVKTDYGEMAFRNISLYREKKAWFDARLENLTDTTWHVVTFNVSYSCDLARFEYMIVLPTINPGTEDVSDRPVVQGLPFCQNPSAVNIQYRSGDSDRAAAERRQAAAEARRALDEETARARAEAEAERTKAEAEIAKTEAARVAARAKEKADRARIEAAKVAAAKKETDRIAKLPRLFNGAEAIFVGSDRKCEQQFVETIPMDGLEKRKRLAELVSYGCGFIANAGTHLTVIQSSGGYSYVVVEDGNQAGKSGWVVSSWVKP